MDKIPDHEQPPWPVGTIVKLNPASYGFKQWSALLRSSGPFIVTKVDLVNSNDGSEIQRMSDGHIFKCGVPRPWWVLLEPFLDAARKANESDGQY